jgi:hypothetical protein
MPASEIPASDLPDPLFEAPMLPVTDRAIDPPPAR